LLTISATLICKKTAKEIAMALVILVMKTQAVATVIAILMIVTAMNTNYMIRIQMLYECKNELRRFSHL